MILLTKSEIQSNKNISEKTIINARKKYSWENILNTEHGIFVVRAYIEGCIHEYHNQLRECLLEQSIDIGEIDLESPSSLKEAVIRQCESDE